MAKNKKYPITPFGFHYTTLILLTIGLIAVIAMAVLWIQFMIDEPSYQMKQWSRNCRAYKTMMRSQQAEQIASRCNFDAVCTANEDRSQCPDCACGNGSCEPWFDEAVATCPADCPAVELPAPQE